MKRRLIVALGLLLAAAPASFAQIARGNIYGSVTDESAAVLPGATITITGATIGARTVTTDAGGAFRFVGLDAGTYKLTAALSGFGTVSREVRVITGESLNLSFGLKVASVEETVVVTADTPVIDTKKTGTGTTVNREELAKIPNSRDPWAVLRQVPGVLVDRLNQAGTQSGQQSGYTGKGSSQQSSMWVLDGVVITDPAAAGSSPSYFDFDSFEEVSVTTGGADVRVASGGVGINLVTKRGTNNFHGGFRGFFTHKDLQSSNLPSSLRNDSRLCVARDAAANCTEYSDNADHADQISDYGFDLGGPILKDRLWFWGSYGKQDIRIRKFNQNPDKTLLKDFNAKVNWQASGSDMISILWFLGSKEKFGRPATLVGTSSEEAGHSRNQAGLYDSPFHGFWKAEWNHIFGQSLMANAKYSYYDQGFSLTPVGGRDQNEYQDRVNAIARGSSNFYGSNRPAHTVNADFNAFAGSHELKFGFGWRKWRVTSTNSPSGGQVRGINDTRRGLLALVQREMVFGYNGSYTDVYLADTYTRDRLTVTLGARFDHQTAVNSATNVSGNALYPEIMPDLSYAGDPDQKITWNDVSPRLGVTYALDAQRKTMLRGSFAIFADQLNGPDVGDINPIGAVGNRTYGWNDLNGDRFVQRGEVDLSRPDVLPPFLTQPSTVNQLDPDYKARRDMEAIAGIDRELLPNFSVSMNYTFRRTDRLPWARLIGVNNTDWVPCDASTGSGFTAPCQDAGPANAAALDANSFGYILTNRPDVTRRYHGLEVTALKRLSNKWMARVAFSYNNWTQHYKGQNGIQDPNPNLFDQYWNLTAGANEAVLDSKQNGGQLASYSSASGTAYWVGGKWQLSAAALYQLPFNIEVAGNLFARQGYVRPINMTSNNILGLQVLAAEVGSERLPDVWNLDLRLAKNITVFKQLTAAITVDVFNAFNSDTVLRRVDEADAASFNRIEEIMNPRLIRVGARLSF